MAVKDYRTVFTEIYQDAVARPHVAVVKLTFAAGLAYTAHRNPPRAHYEGHLVEAATDLALVSQRTRNPQSYSYVRDIMEIRETGKLRYTSLGLFSVVWRANHQPLNRSFDANFGQWQTWMLQIPERIIDIGIFDHFPKLEAAMIDYDINEDEWR